MLALESMFALGELSTIVSQSAYAWLNTFTILYRVFLLLLLLGLVPGIPRKTGRNADFSLEA